MKCYHTGLPQSMCGHCNNSHALEVEPFRGMRPDDTPRLVHGVWQGRGQSFDVVSSKSMGLTNAAVGRFIRPLTSAWATEQLARDLNKITARLTSAAVAAISVRDSKNIIVQHPMARAAIIPGAKWTRDLGTIRQTPPKKWAIKPKEQTIRRARKR